MSLPYRWINLLLSRVKAGVADTFCRIEDPVHHFSVGCGRHRSWVALLVACDMSPSPPCGWYGLRLTLRYSVPFRRILLRCMFQLLNSSSNLSLRRVLGYRKSEESETSRGEGLRLYEWSGFEATLLKHLRAGGSRVYLNHRQE